MKYLSFVVTTIFIVLCASNIHSQTNVLTTPDTLQEFQQYINSLDPNDISTLDKLVNRYRQVFENSSVFTRDTAFIVFWRFYVTVGDSLGGKYVQDEKYNSFYNIKNFDENSSKNEKLKLSLISKNKNLTEHDFAILKKLNHYGYKFDIIEGNILISIADSKFILKNFAGLISSGMKQYITKVIEEIDTAENSDKALTISVDEIANRLLWWENFINKNKDFLLIDDCVSTYDGYLYTLMMGTDSSPAFNNGDQKLNEKFKRTYERIIKNSRGTKAAEIISKYYNILKNNNFIINDESVNFAQKFID
jgi:hypothetical protein